MDWLLRIFSPPPFPDLPIGIFGKVPGAKNLIVAAFELAYFAGVRDGAFVLGTVCLVIGFTFGRRRSRA